jgi:HAD superfamily hydrolase (TIGR01549 family)
MNNIKAIFFDLDGTLRINSPTGGEVFLEYLNNLDMHFSEGDRLRVEHWEYMYFANSVEVKEDSLRFEGDFAGFWINYSKRRLMAFGISETQAAELAPKISQHMNDNYKPFVEIPEEIPTILTLLQEAGYILAVVSNRETPFNEELKDLGIDSYFNFTLAAGEVGAFKPDAPIFLRALEMAGVSADEALYIGDNYFADIIGSQNAGLIPVLYDPTGLFPEAECAVIKSYHELHDVLKSLSRE